MLPIIGHYIAALFGNKKQEVQEPKDVTITSSLCMIADPETDIIQCEEAQSGPGV